MEHELKKKHPKSPQSMQTAFWPIRLSILSLRWLVSH